MVFCHAIFTALLSNYESDPEKIEAYWLEIKTRYSAAGRYYHTMKHLDSLLKELLPYHDQLEDEDMVWFALFYHDVIYNVQRLDNEVESARFAENVLRNLGIEPARIERCKRHILATRGHGMHLDTDTNFFTDADLSILGAEEEVYDEYCRKIRQEYAVYEDPVYRTGRIKVLMHFLEKGTIYKTKPFRDRLENNAVMNLKAELGF